MMRLDLMLVAFASDSSRNLSEYTYNPMNSMFSATEPFIYNFEVIYILCEIVQKS